MHLIIAEEHLGKPDRAILAATRKWYQKDGAYPPTLRHESWSASRARGGGGLRAGLMNWRARSYPAEPHRRGHHQADREEDRQPIQKLSKKADLVLPPIMIRKGTIRRPTNSPCEVNPTVKINRARFSAITPAGSRRRLNLTDLDFDLAAAGRPARRSTMWARR